MPTLPRLGLRVAPPPFLQTETNKIFNKIVELQKIGCSTQMLNLATKNIGYVRESLFPLNCKQLRKDFEYWAVAILSPQFERQFGLA